MNITQLLLSEGSIQGQIAFVYSEYTVRGIGAPTFKGSCGPCLKFRSNGSFSESEAPLDIPSLQGSPEASLRGSLEGKV